MSTVKDDLPDHVLALLDRMMGEFRNELLEATTGEGAETLAPALRGLRSSQMRLLSLTPPEGMRVTDLADRVGMTKQALGEFADVLEEKGLLETVRDPADRRVRILRPTPRGLEAVAASRALIDRIERRWRRRLGAAKWDQLKRLLGEAYASRPAAARASASSTASRKARTT